MSKPTDRKKSIFNNLDFLQNYQKTFNNYTNAAKYFTNNSQIIDSIEKIINSYKDGVITFKKKLVQVKALIKPLYNEEKKTFKFDEKIYLFNNLLIFNLNQIFNNQIELFSNILNDLEKNIFLESEKKRMNDFANILQQNQKNLQVNYKKMEKSFNEYNIEFKKFHENFDDIEQRVQRFYSKSRKNHKLNDKIFNELFSEANNIHNNYMKQHEKFQESNKKFFNFYSDKMKEFEDEAKKNNNYTEKIIKNFNSILINHGKIFLNSLEEKNNRTDETPKEETKSEKAETPKQIKEVDNLQNFKEKCLAPIENEYQNGKYKLKVVDCKILGDNIPIESKEIINNVFDEVGFEDDGYEDTTNTVLTDEDVYDTVKFFKSGFDFVEITDYDLIIEKKKIEVRKLTEKLLCFGMQKKDPKGNKDLKPITEDEYKQLETFIKAKKEYRLSFLYKYNFYRTFGFFDMPEKEYDLTKKMYILITDCIADDKENEEDFNTFKLLIILSQTFYINKDGEKHYLIKDIKGHRLFSEIDYITKYLDCCINEEFEKSKSKSEAGISEKAKKDIVFATILPFCNYMSEFGVSKESLLKINDSICKQYQLPDDLKTNLIMMIESQ